MGAGENWGSEEEWLGYGGRAGHRVERRASIVGVAQQWLDADSTACAAFGSVRAADSTIFC